MNNGENRKPFVLLRKERTVWKFLIMIRFVGKAGQKLFYRPLCKFAAQADPYYILGVEKHLPFDEIKKAFYKLANEFHPDKNSSQVLIPMDPVSSTKIRHHQASLRKHQDGEGPDETPESVLKWWPRIDEAQPWAVFNWGGLKLQELQRLYRLLLKGSRERRVYGLQQFFQDHQGH